LSFYNSTTSSDSSPSSIPTCCQLDAGVAEVLWYTSSIEITIKTVSTIVYKYNNTAITNLRTVLANNSLPDFYFDDGYSLPTEYNIPNTIIDEGYTQLTTLITGTAFTDPYGVVYNSPTPVLVISDVDYTTYDATSSAGGYFCPDVEDTMMEEGPPEDALDVATVYPSGKSFPSF
jgi:hypothetical protein